MNKRNYQKELENIIGELPQGHRPRLLLHSCCAPCSSYCIEYLASYFDIRLYYYNPNISPEEEYMKRAGELERLVEQMYERGALRPGSVEAVRGSYEPQLFYEMTRGMEELPEGGERCYRCYEQRMESAARYAADEHFDYYTTTLSISPMKNPVWINEIGERLGDKYGIRHLPSEFKKKGGYQRSIQLSAEYELYRQNFCGCVFSQRDALKRDELKKKQKYKSINVKEETAADREP